MSAFTGAGYVGELVWLDSAADVRLDPEIIRVGGFGDLRYGRDDGFFDAHRNGSLFERAVKNVSQTRRKDAG